MKRRRILVVLGSTLFAFLLVEVGWRIYLFNFAPARRVQKYARMADIPVHKRIFAPHPYLGYCNNPSYEDPPNRHNGLGFRGEEFPKVKPSGVYRIACLGGSSTYGTEIRDPREAYPAQLEEALREIHGHRQVHVINAGVGGYTSWESALNLTFRVLELEPDLIVVYHATNDVHARMVPPATFRRDNTGYRQPWTDRTRWWDHSAFLHYVGVKLRFSQRNDLYHWVNVDRGEVDPEACLAANDARYFRRNLEMIVTLCKARGVAVLLTSWAYSTRKGDYVGTPVYRRGIAQHNAVSRDVAGETGVHYFDLACVMPQGESLWRDGRHNSPEGARIKAKLMAAHIDEQILNKDRRN